MPNPRHVRVKMADIAQLAGVSVSTVSRALADSPLVPLATRDEIVRLAQGRGYVVNQSARNLRLQRTQTIAVVTPLAHETGRPVSDPLFLELVGRLADEIATRGYDLLLTRVPTPSPNWLRRLIQSGRSDGVVVIGPSDQHETLSEVALEYLPLVVWGAVQPGQTYCSVGVDNVAGGDLATEHLLRLGRRRIAFLGASNLPASVQRQQGYAEALGRAGLEPNPRLVGATHLPGAAVAAPLEDLLESGEPFDGLVCASDGVAMEALRALHARGRRAPEDVAVIGFDDVAMAAQSSPPLTTVDQDLGDAARAMVDALFRRIAGEAAPSATLPARLVVRGSTRAPG